ncbi:hypothetical protein P7C73_g2775, partial [Tremellales sp. Uapishka_1]
MSTPTLADAAGPKRDSMTSNDPAAKAEKAEIEASRGNGHEAKYNHPLAKLGQSRKNFLLFVFSIASFIDVCNISGVAIAVAQIQSDIGLGLSQIVWIITSYSLCFSAFLLLGGRLSDLVPAQLVFEGGFVALGIISLITSFVTSNKYGFLILRGLGGISGAMTIPSAYHLLVAMFPNPEEQEKKLALLGMAGAIGNVLGLVLAGICMLANYRWFFRVIAILCIVFSILTIVFLPYTPSSYSQEKDAMPRWKRLDLVGVVLMAGTLICFILALTQGPIDGWSSASFIAPFILAWFIGVGFFLWESYIPPISAVLPSSLWKTSNIIISSLAVLFPFAFWATSQLGYSTYFQDELHWKPIHVAAAIVPQGVMGLIVGGSAQFVPQIISKPRHTIAIGAVLIIIGEILQVLSNGGHGKDYWKFVFPGFIVGSAGAILSFFAASINLITSCPPEMAGVAGAWTQVLAQVGGAICLAVQAGLQGNNLDDWKHSSARGFYFMIAFTAVLAIQYVVFYKTPESKEREHELARERIAASGRGEGV